jgi:hypothetical protein
MVWRDQMNFLQKYFLLTGYFINYEQKKFNFNFENIDPIKFEGFNRDELIEIGIEKLKRSIKKEYSSGDVLVPISGGLDSRIILAGLVEILPIGKIHTYTYGYPGSYDFEIGNKVADLYGTDHRSYSLKDYRFSYEEEMEVSKRFDRQTHLFFHPPYNQIDSDFGLKNIWSGFLGGEIGGSHVREFPSESIESALLFFQNKNIINQKSNLSSIEITLVSWFIVT